MTEGEARYYRWQGAFGAMWKDIGSVSARVLSHARLAVAAEREACAVLIEWSSLDWAEGDPRKIIAAAVRARGAK